MGVRGVDSSRIIWSVPIVAHRLRSRARGRGQAGNQQRSRKVPFAPASTDQRCRSMPPPRPPERGAATCSRGRFWGDSEPALRKSKETMPISDFSIVVMRLVPTRQPATLKRAIAIHFCSNSKKERFTKVALYFQRLGHCQKYHRSPPNECVE